MMLHKAPSSAACTAASQASTKCPFRRPACPHRRAHTRQAVHAAAAAGNGAQVVPVAPVNGNGNGAAASPSRVHATIQETASYISSRCSLRPEVVMVLGSGLGPIADEVQDATVIQYADIPHFHAPGVQGHPGRLVLGTFAGVPALVLQGRFHYYEGHPMEEVVFPMRVASALGAHTAVITNAAGGINHAFHLGDLMLINDHLNLMATNPLRGPNPPELGGPRFLDLSEPYDVQLSALLRTKAGELGFGGSVRSGVYAAVSGPTYETPAETRMLRALGADAVGMSTVPEVIAARHLGMRVVGISCITNLACGISHDGEVAKVTHEEVMENISLGMDKMRRMLLAAAPSMVAGAAVAATQ